MRKFRELLKFSKPKTPGFGISSQFYLSVLTATAQMPSLIALVNPKGEGGAVEGFGVPLGSDDKSVLNQPMARGLYAVASKDRKTVLKMTVISKEEAGFDPGAFLQSALAAEIGPDLRARIASTWMLIQFQFESHDADVYPAVELLHRLAQRAALLTDGVIADPLSRRYLLPNQMAYPDRPNAPIDAREVVAIRFRALPEGIHAYTLGLQKFVLPELELHGLLPGSEQRAGTLLTSLAQAALMGLALRPGNVFGAKDKPFTLAEGGLDRTLWQGVACYELLPPTGVPVEDALLAWNLGALG